MAMDVEKNGASRRFAARTRPQAESLGWRARVLVAVGRVYARGFHRLEVLTPCPLPKSGPAILISNHVSGLDPVLIQSACPRLITWMMAREYYEIRAMRWGFEAIGAIPVERMGRDLASTRAALRALKRGEVLGIFPEGRIAKDSEMLPFHPGAAMLAEHSGAPVYAAYIDGSQRMTDMLTVFVHGQAAKLTFGGRVSLNEDGEIDLEAATARMRAAIVNIRGRQASVMESRLLAYRG
jgi:1-acyl-sn-glycerol-3-phosphate acyltransferase